MNPNFKTNRFLEAAIAEGTFKWEQEKAPKAEGLDPTIIRATMLDEEVVKITIPKDATIEKKDLDPAGTYFEVRFAGVQICCRDFEPKAGTKVTVRAEMCIRTWEPLGASERQTEKNVYRNYELFVDAYYSDVQATCLLLVYETQTKEYGMGTQFGRRHPDMVGEGGHYCHVSGDRKRNYHFQFVAERKPSRKPVMAEALAKAGVGTDVPLHHGERLGGQPGWDD